jgi:hypothetical protein
MAEKRRNSLLFSLLAGNIEVETSSQRLRPPPRNHLILMGLVSKRKKADTSAAGAAGLWKKGGKKRLYVSGRRLLGPVSEPDKVIFQTYSRHACADLCALNFRPVRVLIGESRELNLRRDGFAFTLTSAKNGSRSNREYRRERVSRHSNAKTYLTFQLRPSSSSANRFT